MEVGCWVWRILYIHTTDKVYRNIMPYKKSMVWGFREGLEVAYGGDKEEATI